MIEKLIRLQYGDLLMIAAIPPGLYVLGFFLTGTQVFNPTQEVSRGEGPVIVENIIPENDHSLTSVLINEEPEGQDDGMNRSGTGIKSVDDIKMKITTLSDVTPDASDLSKATADKEVTPEPTIRKRVIPVMPKENPKVAGDEAASDATRQEPDPYASFSWQGSAYTSDIEMRDAAMESIYYNGEFLRDEVITLEETQNVQVVNNEKIMLSSGQEIPAHTVMTGLITYSKERMFITISRVTTRKMEASCHIEVFDQAYTRGLRIRAQGQAGELARDEANDALNDALSGIKLNTPLGGLSIPRIRVKDGHDQLRISNTSTFKLVVQ